MQIINLAGRKKALAIVAHPDDETIWMGGAIIKHPQFDWTIFSLCRQNDKDRAPKFFKVCRFFKAKAIIADLDDDDRLTLKQTIPIIINLIIKNTKTLKIDYLFTHGQNGEYGHQRHIGVHLAVGELIKNRKLNPREAVFCFNYKKIGPYRLAPKKNSDLIIKLTKKEFDKKISLMADIYGFDRQGIDVGLCANPEAFKIL